MKRTRLLQHLHRHGCRMEREGANHTIYVNRDGSRKSAVPRHSEIKPNTVRKICKDLSVAPPTEK